jgi:hypothetical protein
MIQARPIMVYSVDREMFARGAEAGNDLSNAVKSDKCEWYNENGTYSSISRRNEGRKQLLRRDTSDGVRRGRKW